MALGGCTWMAQPLMGPDEARLRRFGPFESSAHKNGRSVTRVYFGSILGSPPSTWRVAAASKCTILFCAPRGAKMSRWIVFDQPTADMVESSTGIRPEVRGDATADAVVELALNSPTALAVLPDEQPGNAVLMRVTRPQPGRRSSPPRTTSNLAPAGFLGLSDGIDMVSEPEQPVKWWQRILD